MSITTLTTAIAALGHTIIALDSPITTEADALAWKNHLDFVSGPTEQHDAILIVPFTDIEAAETFAAYAPVKTSYRFVAVCYHGATGQAAELSASLAAALADSADPALPFNGVNLAGLTPVEPAFNLTKTRIEAALHNGVCVIQTGADGVPEIVRAITTYQQTPEGEDDDILLDVNGPLVLAYVRKTMRQIAKSQPRRKNTLRQRRDLRSAFLEGCMKLDTAEILKNVDARKDALTVDADPNDEYRVNVRIPADWVRGMHVIAATLDVY
jgi:phage tail sheath gpL-like